MVWIRRSAYFVSALVALAALFLTVFSLVNLYQHRLLKPVLTLSASTPNATHRPFYFWRDRNTLILNPNNGPPLFQTVNTVTGESATLDILTKTISGEISWLFASPDGQSIYWSIPRYGPNGFLLSSELHQMALDGSGHSIALLPPDSDAIPLQDMTTGIYSIRSSQAGGIRPITFVPTGNAPQRTPDSDVFFAGIPGGLSRRPWILGEVQNGAVTDGTGVDVFANDQARRGNYNIGPGWAHLSFPQYPGAASTPAEVSLLKLPDLRTASPAPAHRSVVTFPEGIHEVYLRLSPDGKRIVYLTTESYPAELYRIRWSLYRMAHSLKLNVRQPPSAVQRIFISDPDGSHLQQMDAVPLSRSSQFVPPEAPCWTPDSRSVSFFRENTLYRLDVPDSF